MIVAAFLITVATLGQLLGYWFALPEHIMDQAWPMHARFHIIQSACWITGLDVAIFVLAWWPLQHQERWSLWALLALFLFAQTNHFIAWLALPKGRPLSKGNWYDWMLGLDLVLFAAGLLFATTISGMF